MIGWQILEGEEVVQVEHERWLRFVEADGGLDLRRRVALTVFPNGNVVSSVFLLAPHFGPGDPNYTWPFETMVFESLEQGRVGKALDEYTQRVATYRQAQTTHAEVCRWLAHDTGQAVP